MSETEHFQQAASKKRWKLFRPWAKAYRLAALLWPHARGHKALLVLGILVSGVLIALRLAQPWPLKWVIDALSDTPVPFSPTLGEKNHLIAILSVLYITVSVLAVTAQYFQQLLLNGLGNRIMFDFRSRLFSHLLNLSLSFHEKHTIGEMVTRIVSDTARLRRGVNGILIGTLQVVFTFLAITVVVLKLDWRMALILGVCGVLALTVMSSTGRKILRAARRNRRREGQLAAVVAEDLHGIRELQTFHQGDLRDERFDRKNAKSLKDEQKVRRLEAGLLIRTESLLAAGICLIIWIGSIAVQNGELSLGSLVLFIHYAVGLYGPFRQFAQQTSRSGRTIACAERLTHIMETETTVRDAPDAVPLSEAPRVINFSGVSYKTPRRHRTGRKWVLQDATFDIRGGEKIAVMGRNGAGKSSLLKLMLRLVDPQEGSISFDGRDIRGYALDSLRSRISVVFQDSVLFGLTVRENICLGRPGATIEEVRYVVGRCGLDAWIEGLRDGYDTIVRRQGLLFSGGERQKLALLRAMLRNGDIWLLDEPTNVLDEASRTGFVNLLLGVTQNRTTLWVTHDAETLQYCQRVLFMEEGKIGFFGTPKEFSFWLGSRGSLTGGATNFSQGEK